MALRYAHASDFNVVADCFARQEAAALLGVSLKTFQRWQRGAVRVPWAAYQLLYERSKYGLGERDAAEGFQRQAILGELEALRSRVLALESTLAAQSRLVNWGCANDPFITPTDPRSKVILDGTSVML